MNAPIRPVSIHKGNTSTLILVYLLTSVGIAITGYLYYLNYEHNFRVNVESQLSSIAELKAVQLIQWRKERLGDGATLFKNPAFSSLVQRFLEKPGDMEAQKHLKVWLGKYHTEFQYLRVALFDTEGVLRLSVPEAPNMVELFNPHSINDILNVGQELFLDFHRDISDGLVHLALQVPLLLEADNNRHLGLLVMDIDPANYLFPLINRWPTPGQTTETQLVRRDGDAVLFLNNVKYQRKASLNLRIPMSKTEAPSVLAVLGFTGIVEGIGYDGQPVVAAVVPIRDTPWFLISKINTSEIYAPLRERLWLMVAIVGLLLTGAALVIGVIWKHRSARFYREQKEAGELLRKSDRKYKELTEQASEGIFTVDHKGQYTDANPAGLQMLGYSFSDLKGMLLTDLIWREDLKNTPSELPEILSGKIVTTERTLIKGNGVRFQAEITSKLINDGSILVTKRDITERKKAEEELLVAKDRAEEATKLKDKFVEMVAHDLKSPFTSMLGCLKLLVERIPPLEDVNNQKIVDIIFKSGDRMLATIDDLLKVSRFRTGQITPQLSFFKGRMAVAVAIQSLSQNATEKGIEIINDVPMDMRLFADQSLFDEILINLLSNAIKFCSRGDRITCFTPPGLSSAIAIQDTGKGIHERNMLNLFKHEVKTSTVGTAGEIGTGLGLPFSHDIIKAHGGKLTVESAPGKGSVFCAELPYIKPIALVVDDDDLALEILREHLESIGLDVVCALNGEKALVALKDKRPHIIITDVNMPTMNGYTLLSLLKNDRATKEIPVIVITASDREAREKALMLGADDFVGKPVAIEEFIPRVRRFTG